MKKVLSFTVFVTALGYFVDMFALTLFGVVRVESLHALGVSDPNQVLEKGVFLLNNQMLGMLIGGLLWGVLGDKKGRLFVLLGSISVYSVANILNAFVSSVEAYGWLRFIAGVGLAGELGAAITMVSEVLPPETRGYGTTLVATLGLLGATAAAVIGQSLGWKTAYIASGTLGLAVLITRLKMIESGMFKNSSSKHIRKGDLRLLLNSGRFLKYILCILIGVPIWFITGILVTLSPELTAQLHLSSPINAGTAVLYCSIGLSLGDLGSGLLSQFLKSRKKAIGAFLGVGALLSFLYSQAGGISSLMFYLLCFALGICGGYWAVFATNAAEQFGTNIRATVATTVPNFVRGSLVLLTSAFLYFKVHFSLIHSAMIVGGSCFVLAFLALYLLPETYGKDLDYFETS